MDTVWQSSGRCVLFFLHPVSVTSIDDLAVFWFVLAICTCVQTRIVAVNIDKSIYDQNIETKKLSFEPNSMGIISIVLISTLLVPYTNLQTRASRQGISRLYDTTKALSYASSPSLSPPKILLAGR
jgi:hypothetical protein